MRASNWIKDGRRLLLGTLLLVTLGKAWGEAVNPGPRGGAAAVTADNAGSSPIAVRPWAEAGWLAEMAGKLPGVPAAAALELVTVTPDKPFEVGVTKIELADIAVGYVTRPRGAPKRLEAALFDARLQPLPNPPAEGGEARTVAGSHKPTYLGPFGVVGLEFRWRTHVPRGTIKIAEGRTFGNLTLLRSLGGRVYDRRTHVLLDDSFSYHRRATERGMFTAYRVPCWHQTPVRIVEDVAFGEAVRLEFPLDPAPEFDAKRVIKAGNATVTLESFGIDTGPRALNGGRGLWCVLHFDPPQARAAVLDFSLLRAGAWKTSENGLSPGTTADNPRLKIGFPEGEYDTLSVAMLPQLRRIVMDLDEIPGLPEENRGVADLFDLRLPLDDAPNAGMFSVNLLSKWLQLQDTTQKGGRQAIRRAGSFETPRDLLRDLLENNRIECEMDSERGELRFVPKLKRRPKPPVPPRSEGITRKKKQGTGSPT